MRAWGSSMTCDAVENTWEKKHVRALVPKVGPRTCRKLYLPGVKNCTQRMAPDVILQPSVILTIASCRFWTRRKLALIHEFMYTHFELNWLLN